MKIITVKSVVFDNLLNSENVLRKHGPSIHCLFDYGTAYLK